VEKVWEEEVPVLPPSIQQTGRGGAPPPVPPRRRGLWGMASALGEKVGEKAASWSEGDKEKKEPKTTVKDTNRLISLPPPTHPSEPPHAKAAVHPPPPVPKRNEERGRRRIPPPLDSESPEPNDNDMGVNGVVTGQTKPVKEESANISVAASKPDPDLEGATAAADIQASATVTPAEEKAVVPADGSPASGSEKFTRSPEVTESAGDISRAPSALSLNASQESFSTPVEETANPFNGTASATTETTPLTPKVELLNTSTDEEKGRDTSRTPEPRSDSASEIKTTHSPASAPPPLPRRAAARGPRTMPSSPPTSRRPMPAVVDSTLNTATCPESEPASDKAAPGPPTPETSTSDPIVTEKPTEGAPEPATSPKDAEATPTSDVKSEVFSASIYSTTTAQDKESEPSLLNGKTCNEINGDVVKNKEVGEVYIGDATWEERTWKDLVRLREDMFWARIGGLR
jgi:hypothetical protein